MKAKILYIERKAVEFVSIENVFREVAGRLPTAKFEFTFKKLPFGNNAPGIFKNLLRFKENDWTIFHITGHIHYMSLILPAEKTVLTIHDLGFLSTRKGLRRYLLKKILLDLPVKKLKYITAVSEATKNEIMARTNCSGQKIRVIENPLPDIFRCEHETEFNESYPVILQVGTSPHKNLDNLIKALAGLRCRLKIIGRMDKTHRRELEVNGIVYENAAELSMAEMKAEYEKADIVAFCSIYEGFGLPIIEAQAMKKPLITSNLSPMREVSGGAACLVNPYDFIDIRRGILKIIDDRKFREQKISEGLLNIERFSPEIIAGQYAALYEEMIRESKNF